MSDTESNPRIPDVVELFSPSVKAVWVNLKILLGIAIVGGVIGYFAGKGYHYTTYTDSVSGFKRAQFHYGTLGGAMSLVSAGFMLATYPLTTYLHFCGAKGIRVGLRDSIAKCRPFWLRQNGLFIVSMLIFGLSFMFFVVPVVFALRNYLLAPYFMLDKNLGIKEALRQSKLYSTASGWMPLMVALFAAAISLISLIPYVGYVTTSVLAFLYSAAPAVLYGYVSKVKVNEHDNKETWSVDF